MPLLIDIDGDFKLCVQILDQVYAQHDVKQVKVILKFSNEYYKCISII